MSVPEAVHLILRAAALGKGGETFVFDMGEPLNIYELARTMMLFAGLKPDEDIPIEFVGLKNGEKITEELWEEWEHPLPTTCERIRVIRETDVLARGILARVKRWRNFSREESEGLVKYIQEITPVPGSSLIIHQSRVPRYPHLPTPSQHSIHWGPHEIPLSRPDIGEREIELVTRVLRSGQLSLGPVLAEFEEKFADYAGTRYAIATSSGTAALHLAVEALGIGPGDEVLTTSFSFVASANCLLYAGAIPSFVDIDPRTLNLDPRLLREAIARDYVWDGGKSRLVNRQSGRVLKAILPVHVFGLLCDMEPILELAEIFNLRIIEEAPAKGWVPLIPESA